MDGRFLRQVDDRYDKWLFFAAFFVGAIGIISLKLLLMPSLLVPCFPIGIMILYSMYLLSSARFSLSLDRAGDNLYYLGLLFTLVSLSYSLMQFVAGTAASDVLRDLIGSFGIALFSTITGMLLRVFIQQYRNDPVDIEKQARSDLADAVRELRHSLLGAVADTNTLRRATTQSMGELAKSVEKTLSKAADSAATAVGNAGNSIKEAAEIVEKAIATQSVQLTGVLDKAGATVGSLSTSIESLRASSSGLGKDLEERAAAEKAATSELRALAVTLRELTFVDLSSSMSQLPQTLSRVGTELGAIGTTLHAANEKLSQVTGEAARAIEKELGSLRELLSALERQAELSRSMTSDVQESLAHVVRAIRSEIARS
jgi:hypothetical protein